MNKGCFYFIDEQFFIDFNDPLLMQNKETVFGEKHKRPCFYAVEDSNGLFWMIPISSKVEKYKTIYDGKLEKSKNGKCDTLAFGDVLGYEKAFLIQNMFPISKEYILEEYIHKNVPVRIDGVTEAEIKSKANKVIALYRHGIKLIFPDVESIEKRLLEKV